MQRYMTQSLQKIAPSKEAELGAASPYSLHWNGTLNTQKCSNFDNKIIEIIWILLRLYL